MKKFKILFLATLSLIISSCGDDFLTLTPTSSILESDYYKTEANIYAALVAAYDPLQWDPFYNGGYTQLQFMSDIRSDDVFVGGDGTPSFHHQMAEYKMDPLKAPESLWKLLYTGVNRCNIVIEKMDLVTDISQANKNRYLAEAHFLRAYYYHWLWKYWGNVPYYSKNLTAPYSAPQIPADTLYKRIIEDLNFATFKDSTSQYLLPKMLPSAELGRVSVWATMMLKARVVMYQNDESRYLEVYNEMKLIKNSYQFRLLTDFKGIWDSKNEWSTESVWEINYRSEGGSWSYPQGGEGTIFPKFIGIPALSSNDPTYLDGWGYEPIRTEVYNLYSDMDIRKDGGVLNFAKHQKQVKDSVGIEISYKPRYEDTGLFNLKYSARKGYNDAAYDVELNFNNNLRIFRYSETLLNIAELAVKLHKSDAQANLDMVRLRSLSSNVAILDANPVKATEESIINERRLEFLGEGMRFWDIIRTNRTSLLNETNQYWSRTWSDNFKYLPIPSSEIDRTNGENKLIQNSGY